jgi:hypothetical protein
VPPWHANHVTGFSEHSVDCRRDTTVHYTLTQTIDWRRNAAQSPPTPKPNRVDVTPVTAKKLISAVTAQNHFYGTTREASDKECGNGG